MKYLKFISALIILLTACKKESTNPTLSFTAGERNWFIYQIGQSFKFKNSLGDSLVYTVTNVRSGFKPEYQDPFTNPVEIGQTEFYAADLKANTDSIFLYFYKEFQYNTDPNKMRQTIRWGKFTSQFVNLATIENQVPFTTMTINNVIYNKVTQVIPTNQDLYPWTIWANANYDQKFGFIELIDLNGRSWRRQ